MYVAQPPPRTTPDPRRLLGQVLADRYRIDELIGEGGMGAIYRAEHVQLRKRLAIKVLHPEMRGVAEAVARFEREAIAGAHIEHPNVATAMDFGNIEDGSHFLVLEYLEGEDLRAVIGRGAIAPTRALRVTRQIALALRAVHQLGIVHRDLKPENVMLVRKDKDADFVKVLDFGIAKVPVDAIAARASKVAALTQAGMVYGTPEYMAPEQAVGADVDGRADLYSVGVILYEMLSGHRPFDAPDRGELIAMVMGSPPPPLSPRVPGGKLSPALEVLVMRLLEKAPGSRLPSAAQLVDAVEALLVPGPKLVVDARASGNAETSLNMAAPKWPSSTSSRETRVASYGGPAGAAIIAARASGPSPSSSTLEASSTPEAIDPARSAARATSLGWMGLAVITAMILGAVLLRSQKAVQSLEEAESELSSPSGQIGSGEPSSAPQPPRITPGQTAPSADLDAARLGGLTTLGSLAVKYPNDPAVLKALMMAHAGDRAGYAAALGVAKRLFELTPKTAGDDDMRKTLLRIANGPTDVAMLAFEALAGKMGSFGPDILYEIATDPSMGKFPRERAGKLMDSADVRKLASTALLVTLDLKPLGACARKPLFPRARDEGDARTLPYLKPLLVTDGCTRAFVMKYDCNACLGGRADLLEAIKAIEARGKR